MQEVYLRDLTKKQKKILRKIEKFMYIRRFPTGHENKTISIKQASEKIEDKNLKNLLLNSAPKLLTGEFELLKIFDIKSRFWARSLNKTSAGNYSVCHDLFISKNDSLLKFYKEINFSLKDKQEKLLNIINNIGGGECAKILQQSDKEERGFQANQKRSCYHL